MAIYLMYVVGIITLTYVVIRFNLSLWKNLKTLHFTFFMIEHRTACKLSLTPIYGQWFAIRTTIQSLALLISRKYRKKIQTMIKKENELFRIFEENGFTPVSQRN